MELSNTKGSGRGRAGGVLPQCPRCYYVNSRRDSVCPKCGTDLTSSDQGASVFQRKINRDSDDIWDYEAPEEYKEKQEMSNTEALMWIATVLCALYSLLSVVATIPYLGFTLISFVFCAVSIFMIRRGTSPYVIIGLAVVPTLLMFYSFFIYLGALIGLIILVAFVIYTVSALYDGGIIGRSKRSA